MSDDGTTGGYGGDTSSYGGSGGNIGAGKVGFGSGDTQGNQGLGGSGGFGPATSPNSQASQPGGSNSGNTSGANIGAGALGGLGGAVSGVASLGSQIGGFLGGMGPDLGSFFGGMLGNLLGGQPAGATAPAPAGMSPVPGVNPVAPAQQAQQPTNPMTPVAPVTPTPGAPAALPTTPSMTPVAPPAVPTAMPGSAQLAAGGFQLMGGNIGTGFEGSPVTGPGYSQQPYGVAPAEGVFGTGISSPAPTGIDPAAQRAAAIAAANAVGAAPTDGVPAGTGLDPGGPKLTQNLTPSIFGNHVVSDAALQGQIDKAAAEDTTFGAGTGPAQTVGEAAVAAISKYGVDQAKQMYGADVVNAAQGVQPTVPGFAPGEVPTPPANIPLPPERPPVDVPAQTFGDVGTMDMPSYLKGLQSIEDPSGAFISNQYGYYGPAQFGKDTWAATVKAHPEIGAPINMKQASADQYTAVTVAHTQDNIAKLSAAGIEVSPVSAYLAHQEGVTGAINTLSHPDDTPVGQLGLSQKQIAANPAIYGGMQTLGDVKANVGAKLAAGAGVQMGAGLSAGALTRAPAGVPSADMPAVNAHNAADTGLPGNMTQTQAFGSASPVAGEGGVTTQTSLGPTTTFGGGTPPLLPPIPATNSLSSLFNSNASTAGLPPLPSGNSLSSIFNTQPGGTYPAPAGLPPLPASNSLSSFFTSGQSSSLAPVPPPVTVVAPQGVQPLPPTNSLSTLFSPPAQMSSEASRDASAIPQVPIGEADTGGLRPLTVPVHTKDSIERVGGGIAEGFGSDPLIDKPTADATVGDEAASQAAGGGAIGSALLRAPRAIFGGLAALPPTLMQHLTPGWLQKRGIGDQASADAMQRDIIGMFESEGGRAGEYGHAPDMTGAFPTERVPKTIGPEVPLSASEKVAAGVGGAQQFPKLRMSNEGYRGEPAPAVEQTPEGFTAPPVEHPSQMTSEASRGTPPPVEQTPPRAAPAVPSQYPDAKFLGKNADDKNVFGIGHGQRIVQDPKTGAFGSGDFQVTKPAAEGAAPPVSSRTLAEQAALQKEAAALSAAGKNEEAAVVYDKLSKSAREAEGTPHSLGAGATPPPEPVKSTEEILKDTIRRREEREALVKPPGIKDGIKKVADTVRKIVNPKSVDAAAERGAAAVRQGIGRATRDSEQTKKALEVVGKITRNMDLGERLDVIDYIETRSAKAATGSSPAPEIEPILNAQKDAMELRRRKLEASPQTEDMAFVEDYLSHMYKDPERYKTWAQGYMTSKEGSKGFTKGRKFPTLADAIRAGHEPITTDPIEMSMRYADNVDRFVGMNEAIDTGIQHGDVIWRSPNQKSRLPEGFIKLEGRRTNKMGQTAYAREGWARVYNNTISKRMEGPVGDIIAGARFLATRSVGAKLSFSGYHIKNMLNEALTGGVSSAIRSLSHGDIPATAGKLIMAPVRPITSAMRGRQMVKAYLGEGGSPAVMRAMERLTDANFRVVGKGRASDEYRFANMHNYWEAYKRGSLKAELMARGSESASGIDLAKRPIAGTLKEMAHVVGRTVDTTMHPLFNYYIPLIKSGAAFDQFETWMKAHPMATEAEQVAYAREAADIVDNRFGEMNQDNLFWSETQRQVMQSTFLSASYTLGTARLATGAVKGAKRFVQGKGVDDNLAYAMALPITMGTIGAIKTYMKTGKPPQDYRDLWWPPTGGIDPQTGQPERETGASYMNSVLGFYNHPTQELMNKLNPLWSGAYHIASGKDWKGEEIALSTDSRLDVVKAYLNQIYKEFGPISLTSEKKQGSAIGPVGTFFGDRPSSLAITDPERQKNLDEYFKLKADQKKIRDDAIHQNYYGTTPASHSDLTIHPK